MAVFLACAGCGTEVAVEETAQVDTVVVYSTLAKRIVNPVFKAYTAESGSKVLLVVGDFKELTRKERKPGREPIADLFIADNVADLWQAAEEDVFRPTRSAVIAERVPAQLQDPEHLWVAFASRARAIVYNPDLTRDMERASVVDYASLADGSWHERLCLSSSAVVENGSLIAMLINDNGVRKTELIVRGWRANLAAPVFTDDQKLLQAMAAGQCAVGIADSSEIAGFLRTNSGASIAPHWFPAGGVLHINASGGGVTRHAQNPEGAVALLEWLTSDAANSLFATLTLGFPANPVSAVDASLAEWSGIEPNPLNVASLGYLQEDAIRLAERARYP
jgi:iron(III) transport system substrate-binding protein